MKKGEATKNTILSHAVKLASAIGLGGLSIGRLAEELKLSKSGLFGHFNSKEALQIQVLESAAQLFAAKVTRPAVKAPRGVPRLRALFENWIKWGLEGPQPGGGCLFIAAAIELDDQPGPVRDALLRIQQSWIQVIERSVELGQQDGLLDKSADPKQVAQDIYGIVMAVHLYHRLFQDPQAIERSRASFEVLMGPLTAGTSDASRPQIKAVKH